MFALSLARRRVVRTPTSFLRVGRGYAAQPETQPQELDTGEQNIFNKLRHQFSPTELRVQDISGGCGSFYAISITSESFKGLSTVKQHRLVNETLKKEIEGIHGLQLKTSTPS